MALRSRSPDAAAWLVIGLLIAAQVAGKSIRDAFFFTQFSTRALPTITIVTAVVSLGTVLVFSRLLAAYGPRRVLVGTLAASGSLLVAIGLVAPWFPRPAAVAMYLVGPVASPLTISAFWALVSERFDVRAVRRSSVWLGAAGTLGGVAAGIVTMAIARRFAVQVAVPAWGLLQILTAALTPLIARGSAAPAHGVAIDPIEGVRRLARNDYVRHIALLVVLGTLCSGLLDYAFKQEVTNRVRGAGPLLSLFSWFYTAASALAFVVQVALARASLKRFGPAGTAAVLPSVVVAFGALALAVPAAWSMVLVRAAELVTRNSVFRSGYELLFGPVPAADRRATKPVIDVGVDRVGDILGGGATQALVGLGPLSGIAALCGAVFVAAVGSVVALQLRGRYVRELETGLLARGGGGALLAGDASLSMRLPRVGLSGEPESIASDVLASGTDWIGDVALVEHAEAPAAQASRSDAELLASGSVADVVSVLSRHQPLPAELMPVALPLLKRNEIAPLLLESIGTPDGAGLAALVAFMRDPSQELAARRRVPRVVARSDRSEAVEALFVGLGDARFEMRVQCGRALLKRNERGGIAVDAARVLAAVEREVAVERHIWDAQQEPARDDWGRDAALFDRVIRARASASLAHVFTLLALVLPRDPVEQALGGLEGDDAIRRGLALEYLESVLPPAVRAKLWPFLERESVARPAAPPRPIEQILAAHESMVISVEELRRLREEAEREAQPGEGASSEPGPPAPSTDA